MNKYTVLTALLIGFSFNQILILLLLIFIFIKFTN